MTKPVRPLRIGLGVPRRVGDPSLPFAPPDHRTMLRYAQWAERLGFDSVWVPDHFYYEWRMMRVTFAKRLAGRPNSRRSGAIRSAYQAM